MKTLIKMISCALVICGMLSPARGTVYSSADVAVRFSHCLLENMASTPFFTREDRNGMADIVDVITNTMRKAKSGPREPFRLKVLLTGFVTSLADIILLEDTRRNFIRKRIYARSLEQCSISSAGYADAEFINIALRIMFNLEKTKVPVHDSREFLTEAEVPSGIQPSPSLESSHDPRFPGVFDRSAVEPSPVQKPITTEDFVADGKANFQIPEGLHGSVPSTGESKSNTSFPIVGQAASIADSSTSNFESGHSEVVETSSEVLHPETSEGSADISVDGFSPNPTVEVSYAPDVYNPQETEVSKSSVVQSTPIQKPFVPEGFVADEKQIFQVPESVYDSAPSFVESKSNTNFPIVSQAASNAESSSSNFEKGQSEILTIFPEKSHAKKSEGISEMSTDDFSHHPTDEIGDIPDIYNPQVPKFSEFSTVQPSPVLNPFISEGLSANSKTAFEVPESSFGFVSSVGKPRLQLPVPAERNKFSPNGHRISERNGNSEDVATSLVPLSIPPTKESTVIPPKNGPQSEENSPSQNETVPITENIPAEIQRDTVNSPKRFDNIDPPALTLNVPDKNYELESIISNILTNSSSFRNAFSLATNQDDAQRLARIITEQSMSLYNPELIEEAMTAVSNAVGKVTLSSPENYASALSEALASVLNLHNIPLFVDGATIASSMLTNLDIKQDFTQQIVSTEKITDVLTTEKSPSWIEEQQPPLNFQSPASTSKNVESEDFNNTLSQYLAGSFKLSKIFCGFNNIENKMETFFRLIKSSMSIYGSQISAIAASTIAESLVELSEDSLCSRYPKVIADIISDILYERGLLDDANPEEILKSLEFSASFLQGEPIQPQQPEVAWSKYYDTSQKSNRSEFDEINPKLQSSYPEEPGALLYQPSERDPSRDVYELSRSSSSPDVLSSIEQQYEKYITETSQDFVTESYDSVFMSPVGEQDADSEFSDYYTIPVTTPFSTKITDKVFSDTRLLIDTLTNLPEESSTIESLSDDSEMNGEELARYLFSEMESALAALNDKFDDQNPTMNSSESVIESEKDKLEDQEPMMSTSKVVVRTVKAELSDQDPEMNPDKSVTETMENMELLMNHTKSAGETSTVLSDMQTEAETKPLTTKRPRNNLQNGKRGHKRKTTISETNSESTPTTSTSLDQGINKAEANLPEQLTSPSLDTQTDSLSFLKEDISSDKRSDRISNITSVNLQPSFQGPQTSDTFPSSKVFSSATHHDEFNDPSLSVAKSLSDIASSSIAFIKSENFDKKELCVKLNDLAAVVGIPPNHRCKEFAVVDYLLNVLLATIHILKGV